MVCRAAWVASCSRCIAPTSGPLAGVHRGDDPLVVLRPADGVLLDGDAVLAGVEVGDQLAHRRTVTAGEAVPVAEGHRRPVVGAPRAAPVSTTGLLTSSAPGGHVARAHPPAAARNWRRSSDMRTLLAVGMTMQVPTASRAIQQDEDLGVAARSDGSGSSGRVTSRSRPTSKERMTGRRSTATSGVAVPKSQRRTRGSDRDGRRAGAEEEQQLPPASKGRSPPTPRWHRPLLTSPCAPSPHSPARSGPSSTAPGSSPTTTTGSGLEERLAGPRGSLRPRRSRCPSRRSRRCRASMTRASTRGRGTAGSSAVPDPTPGPDPADVRRRGLPLDDLGQRDTGGRPRRRALLLHLSTSPPP